MFTECEIDIKKFFDRRKMSGLFSFAGWNLFGGLGLLLRNQGCAVLLNVNYGPKMNAAYGVATQVANASNIITTAMVKAFAPEITTAAGNQNSKRMLRLAQAVNKYGTILLLVVAIPLIIEMDKVLHFWLISPPAFSITFCQLFLGMCLIDRLTTGYMLAVSASGKIAGYQTTLGIVLMATLPLAWIFVKYGLSPISVGFAFIITMSICSLGRVLWVSYLFRIKLTMWFREILLPCSIAAFISVVVSYVLTLQELNTFYLFSLEFSFSVCVTILLVFIIVLHQEEKFYIVNFVHKNLRRIMRM
jgi:O-antigen/teichoic acid export membrane protein